METVITLVLLLISLFLFSNQFKAESTHGYNNNTGINFTAKNFGSSGSSSSNACSYFQGHWVYDASYPLYKYASCPFIDPEFNCQKYGRPDNMYQSYRWQPFSCDLPRFNGLDLLERWRGKKTMFVGDSLSLNIWESLTCMIHASVPNATITYIKKGFLGSVTFDEYQVKILFYRTPYLVDIVDKGMARVLKLDSIQNGNAWLGMDFLVFNSWHWWTHTGSSQPWDYIEDGKKTYKDMNRLVAYYKGLTTWARWVNLNIDPLKTKVYFQGISPNHYDGRDWNEPSKTCFGQTQPFFGKSYPGGTPEAAVVVNKVLERIKIPVYLLDITRLSQYRKDAHPTVYSGDHIGLDCSHWCLPGLPDTWNQLLYAALIG